MYTHHDTLNVPCPQCRPRSASGACRRTGATGTTPYYVHGKRQVAFEIYLTGVKQGADKVVRDVLRPEHGTDPTLVKDVQADIKAVLLILRRNGTASAA